MNNAKEKAIELYDNYFWNIPRVSGDASTIQLMSKKFAIKAVDEVLNIDNIKPYVLHKEIIEFYQEVKKEIELL